MADLIPIEPVPRRWLDRAELLLRLAVAQSDPALREDLAQLAGESTADLGPIR